jgi:hypothetical protein
MRRTRILVAVIAVLAMAAGCASHVTPIDARAQRAEYQSITVDWLRYVEADATLTDEQRERRRRTAAAQDARIRALEEVVK